jgi:hypothetical protein
MTVFASDGTYSIELLTQEQVEKFWPEIEKMLDQIPHTWAEDHTKEELFSRAMSYGLQVWAIGKAPECNSVVFSQICIFSTGRNLELFWGAGEGKWHLTCGELFNAAIEKFAKAAECKRIDIVGREGWQKILKEHGFTKTAVVLSRRVVHSGMQ